MCLQVDGRGEGELSQFSDTNHHGRSVGVCRIRYTLVGGSKKVKDLAEQRSEDMHLASRSSIPCCCYHK